MKKCIYLLVLITIILCGCTTMKTDNSGIKKINCDEKNKLMEKTNTYLIDVREEYEYNENHLQRAINMPVTNIANTIKNNKDITIDSNIIVYCKSGKRSSSTVDILKKLGYKNIYDLGSISNCKK